MLGPSDLPSDALLQRAAGLAIIALYRGTASATRCYRLGRRRRANGLLFKGGGSPDHLARNPELPGALSAGLFLVVDLVAPSGTSFAHAAWFRGGLGFDWQASHFVCPNAVSKPLGRSTRHAPCLAHSGQDRPGVKQSGRVLSHSSKLTQARHEPSLPGLFLPMTH